MRLAEFPRGSQFARATVTNSTKVKPALLVQICFDFGQTEAAKFAIYDPRNGTDI